MNQSRPFCQLQESTPHPVVLRPRSSEPWTIVFRLACDQIWGTPTYRAWVTTVLGERRDVSAPMEKPDASLLLSLRLSDDSGLRMTLEPDSPLSLKNESETIQLRVRTRLGMALVDVPFDEPRAVTRSLVRLVDAVCGSS